MKPVQFFKSFFPDIDHRGYLFLLLITFFTLQISYQSVAQQTESKKPGLLTKLQKAQLAVETQEKAVVHADSLLEAAESAMDQAKEELQGAKNQMKEIDKNYSFDIRPVEKELKTAKGQDRVTAMESKKKLDAQYKLSKKENETTQKNALRKFEKGKKDLAKAHEKLKQANVKLKEARKAFKEAEKAEEKK